MPPIMGRRIPDGRVYGRALRDGSCEGNPAGSPFILPESILVHLEAQKLGLKGILKEESLKMRILIKKIYLLAPLIVLVALCIDQYLHNAVFCIRSYLYCNWRWFD